MAEEQLLVELDDYLKAGIHIGTKLRTKFMKKFIYKVRPEGLSVLNVEQINSRLKNAINFLSQYEPEDILVVCRRENGWKPAKMFSKVTGVRVIIGRYPPGLLTNTDLEDFMESKVILVCDPWPDKNAVQDAARVGIPVVALCDTNNETSNVDLVVPCNNKGKKSLAIILWILAKNYMVNKGLIKSEKEFKHSLEDFTAE